MSVQTEFWNFQQLGAPQPVDDFAKAGFTSPNLLRIYKYCKEVYGGQLLGIRPNPRTIRNGAAPSTHTWGALDWRYENPGPGRQVILDELLPLLIEWSLELGVQAIHDYLGDRIWRPPFTSGRGSNGWVKQNGRGSGMGELWAGYLHVEVHPDTWFDERDVRNVLLGAPLQPPVVTIPPVPPVPGEEVGEEIIVNFRSREMVKGMTGNDIKWLQERMNTVGGKQLVVDGQFGAKTEQAVKDWQLFFGMLDDGKAGPQTQQSIIEVSMQVGK